MVKGVAFTAILFGTAGCATHTWMPGPDARGTFSEASGRCQLLANNTGGGFYAQGKPAFVAGAAAGAAIGQAIKAQNNYNACMMASGWEIEDTPRTALASYTPPPASFNTNPPAMSPGYTGGMKNGKREGHGTAVYADGSRYIGEFKNDMRSGHGHWTDTKGNSYDGEWANDKRNGFGVASEVYFQGFGQKIRDEQGIWKDGVLVHSQTTGAPKAYETAMTNIDGHRWDKYTYYTLCDVALLLVEKGETPYLLEEALNHTRRAAETILDPEMSKRIREYEDAFARHVH